MSNLDQLYQDESDSDSEDRDHSSFADDNERLVASMLDGDPSEETLEDERSEEVEQHDDDDDDDNEEDDEEDDTDKRARDNHDDEDEEPSSEREGSERDDESGRESESGRERDEEESAQDGDQSSNKESDDDDEESYGAKPKDESSATDKQEESDSGYDREAPESSDDEDDNGQNKDRGFDVYGNDDPEDFKDEPDDPEQPMPPPVEGSGAMSGSQKTCFFCWCLICMIIALIGGAVIGAILTDEDSSFRNVLGIEPSEDKDDDNECGGGGNSELPPISQGPPTSVFKCDKENVPLEFRIIFDAKPGDVGVRASDDYGTSMWNFPTRSFGSFALMLRENIFTLCLSPQQNYTFEITDLGADGFMSSLGGPIYHAWTFSW